MTAAKDLGEKRSVGDKCVNVFGVCVKTDRELACGCAWMSTCVLIVSVYASEWIMQILLSYMWEHTHVQFASDFIPSDESR